MCHVMQGYAVTCSSSFEVMLGRTETTEWQLDEIGFTFSFMVAAIRLLDMDA
jgi:hypothetical protein